MKSLTFIEIDVPEFDASNAGEKRVMPGLAFNFDSNALLGLSLIHI